jgi:hypothetical protein
MSLMMSGRMLALWQSLSQFAAGFARSALEGKEPETAMLRGNAISGQSKAGAEGTFAPVKGDFAPNDACLAAVG